MKKLLRNLLLIGATLFAYETAKAQTVTVTADLKTMFGTAQATKTQVCFSLTDGNGNQLSNPRTSSGVLVPTATQCVSPDGSGHVSTPVIANDQITPSNSIYSVTYLFNGRSVHGDIFQFALADGTENLNTKTSLSTIPVISAPTGDQTYLRLDGGNNPLAFLNVTGTVTEITGQNQYKAYAINSVIWVDAIHYTTIAAALADCPSTGGKIEVPPNWSSNEPSWTLKKYCVIHHNGPCAVNFGTNNISVPVGVNGAAIDSDIPFGGPVINAGCVYTYTGNSVFATVGANTGDTLDFRMSNIDFNLNNAGSAAQALDIIRTQRCRLDNITVVGPGGANTQQGIILDGTNNFTGCKIELPIVTGVLTGIQFTGVGVNSANASQIVGGNISSPATGASKGVDFQAGSGGNTINGTDVEGMAIGYNFAGTSTGNFIVGRSEGNTSGATLGASTSSNHVELINTTDPISNSGTNNTTCTNGICTYPTINAGVLKGVGANTLTVQDGSGAARITSTNSNLFINLGGGATLFGPNASPIFLLSGLMSNYNQIATEGNGLASVHKATIQKSESAADTNVLTFTPPAAVGKYRLSFTMAVSAQNTATLGWTATYKDANGTAQAPTNLALSTIGASGSALTITAATNGNYYGSVDIDTDASATNIVIKLTFTGTSFTAKVSATVERVI